LEVRKKAISRSDRLGKCEAGIVEHA